MPWHLTVWIEAGDLAPATTTARTATARSSPDGCSNWPAGFGGDLTCFGDATPSRFPGGLVRGGSFGFGPNAGPFAVRASPQPSIDSNDDIGFRGAR